MCIVSNCSFWDNVATMDIQSNSGWLCITSNNFDKSENSGNYAIAVSSGLDRVVVTNNIGYRCSLNIMSNENTTINVNNTFHA